MIPADERARMLQIPLCGPRVIMRLESIGITRLDDLAGRALTNLVDAASRNRATLQRPQHLSLAAPGS